MLIIICYVFLKKSPYDGPIKHMTFILFSASFHYDANYMYDAYLAVESSDEAKVIKMDLQ